MANRLSLPLLITRLRDSDPVTRLNAALVEGVVIVGFALAPNFAQAQEWSAEELDLFEQVEHCQEGYGARTWEEQVRECGLDASLQYWMAGEAEPRGIDWMREAVENVWPEIEVMSQDFEPVGSRTIRERDGDVVPFALSPSYGLLTAREAHDG